MPTLLRWKGYRFFFYSADGWEPPHVHVKDGRDAQIWLRDITVAVNLGFTARDLSEIIAATRDHQTAFMEAWNDYFGA